MFREARRAVAGAELRATHRGRAVRLGLPRTHVVLLRAFVHVVSAKTRPARFQCPLVVQFTAPSTHPILLHCRVRCGSRVHSVCAARLARTMSAAASTYAHLRWPLLLAAASLAAAPLRGAGASCYGCGAVQVRHVPFYGGSICVYAQKSSGLPAVASPSIDRSIDRHSLMQY